MSTQMKKSKLAGEGAKEILSHSNLTQDTWYNELQLTADNIERIAEKLGGEVREAWLYGEWVKVAITFSQIYSINHRLETSVKTVFIGEYLEENQRTRFIHIRVNPSTRSRTDG